MFLIVGIKFTFMSFQIFATNKAFSILFLTSFGANEMIGFCKFGKEVPLKAFGQFFGMWKTVPTKCCLSLSLLAYCISWLLSRNG